MYIPVKNVGGSGSEKYLVVLNAAGLLPASMGGSASTLAALDSSAQVPALNAPAKAVYASGGGQALAVTDIGAQAQDDDLDADCTVQVHDRWGRFHAHDSDVYYNLGDDDHLVLAPSESFIIGNG